MLKITLYLSCIENLVMVVGNVHKDLPAVWIAEGDDEVECLKVEIWIDDFPVHVMVAYGPQVGDSLDRKRKFCEFIEKEADIAHTVGAWGRVYTADGQ